MKSEVNFYWKYRCINIRMFSEIIWPHYGAVAVILEKICCVLNPHVLRIWDETLPPSSGTHNGRKVPILIKIKFLKIVKMRTKLKDTRPWCLVQFLFNEQEIVSNIHIFFTSRKKIHFGGVKKEFSQTSRSTFQFIILAFTVQKRNHSIFWSFLVHMIMKSY